MSRLSALARRLDELGHDALLVTTPSNIVYLSGFTGTSGYLIVRADGTGVVVTDARYSERVEDELRDEPGLSFEIAPGRGLGRLPELFAPGTTVGVEADHLSWSEATETKERLEGCNVVATSGLVESLREYKDDEEVALIRAAAEIADASLAALLDKLRPGATERDVAWEFAKGVREAGGDAIAYETIVASGPNASRPHHATGDRELAIGDLVIIDAGATVEGYRSDMTRTFVLGPATSRQQELLDAVLAAQTAGIAAVTPGIVSSDIDAACRNSLTQSGLGEWFTHGTGHGVGLDIHEAPSVHAAATATLAPGHVLTVEPGVYLPGEGGVRWEDTIVVTSSGATPLTLAPKQPIIDT